MKRAPTNLAASVHRRLLYLARAAHRSSHPNLAVLSVQYHPSPGEHDAIFPQRIG
jgi:hypothetical protein